jgi:RNA polymerase primary sigma factor
MANAYINDFNTTVQTYYKELKKCNPISREKERELLIKAKKNDVRAKNLILTSNLKFVFDVAKNYKGCGVPLEDLISEGNMGLTKAIDKFDLEKDVKFISYAVWWVRQSIQAYIKKEQKTSAHEVSESDDLNSHIRENAFEDDEDEIVNKNEVILSNEDDESNKELKRNQKIVIDRLMSKLDDRGKFIINAYFGLDGSKPKTLEEIGKNLGSISKERIRQLKMKSLRILRSELMMSDNMELLFR